MKPSIDKILFVSKVKNIGHGIFTMKPFIDKRLFVSKVKNIGYGIFTSEDIPKKTIIEVAISKHVYKNQVCKDLELIDNYIYKYDGKKSSLALGFGSIYNHASNGINNVTYTVLNNKIIYKTIKAVEKNQQLTINYGYTWFKNRNLKVTNKIIYTNKKKEQPVFVSRKIEIKKNGVYANEKIAKNETVEISHTINFKNIFYLNAKHSLSKMFFYNKQNNFLIPLGFANIYKVNKDYNVNYFIKNKKVYFIANVEINSGDELTISEQNYIN